MQGIVVRRATAEDKEEVLSFCVGTFDWGDYIDEVYDMWLASPDSLFLVALDGKEPVGILNSWKMEHGVAWLEGLRVKPDHRRMGVASTLTEKALEMLARSGHTTVRLLVESNNGPSMALASSQGFSEEFSWVFFRGRKPKEEASHGARRVSPATAARVWEHLDSSDLFNRASRSYEMDWALHPLERDDFDGLVRRRMVAVAGEGKGMAVAIFEDGGKGRRWAKACFLLGDAPQVGELSSFVMSQCFKAKARRLNVSCPNHAGVVQALKARGFRPGFRTSLVFVRRA